MTEMRKKIAKFLAQSWQHAGHPVADKTGLTLVFVFTIFRVHLVTTAMETGTSSQGLLSLRHEIAT